MYIKPPDRFAGSIFMPPLLLKSYEGLVGAKLSGQLEGFFVTSPNMDVLTLPLVGTQTIRHRLQLHYGEHDPFLVAQPFDIRTAYLAMIRYPHSSDSTTTILWDLLDESEFEPIVDQKLADDPLGKFPNHYVKQLDQYHQTVRSSHSQLAHTQGMSDHWAKSRIEEYSYGIWYLLAKLDSPMLSTMHLVHFD
ncbi:hypothetical protein DFH05DRAFT_1519664 [Lentinula detonsa]|uniref:Uncharacterized protein n=1 Tax=Lentinula detonsa TaxID=2804962 RepID=A0A9W8U3V2_9AGAR|nr:hypothetical protein DFH05DRAFT_1519664 [Lentinula detonsa]